MSQVIHFLEKIIEKSCKKQDAQTFFKLFETPADIDPSILEKTAIIIPCYNEKENLALLLPQIMQLSTKLHIYLVDDGSTDGTRELILDLGREFRTIFLFQRDKKDGLGSAYKYAFEKILKETSHQFFIQMDGDGSHSPNFLYSLLTAIQSADVVIGSRYINGISALNWPIYRLIMSYLVNFYYKTFTRIPIQDFTSGFKCFRRKVLERINLQKLSSEGFFFQVEMNMLTSKLGFSILETPIIFFDRNYGESKMDYKVLLETTLLGAFLPFRTYETNTT